MLNPGLDIDSWVSLANPEFFDPGFFDNNVDLENMPIDFDKVKKFIHDKRNNKQQETKIKQKKITKQKFLGLEEYLKSQVIGQNEAIKEVVNALKRSQVGLSDENRPLGIFLFAGASGVGKTHLAASVSRYLFGENSQLVRIDCGEYQHKHENQKLIGSPPGYVGHDEGGHLVNMMKKNPNTVILLDEVEKAHVDLWNTFLRVFEDGILTDAKGEQISFKNSIIILTTNLGNEKTVNYLTSPGAGFTRNIDTKLTTSETPQRSMVEKNSLEAIKKYFKPEFLNRLDKIIVFNYLSYEDFSNIGKLEMYKVVDKLSKKGFIASYTDEVIDALIKKGVDSIQGARGISKVRRDLIETPLADILIATSVPRGSKFEIAFSENEFIFKTIKPKKKQPKYSTLQT
jgi:ATP-dependent Clp protease ATP-binding subunit ClpC